MFAAREWYRKYPHGEECAFLVRSFKTHNMRYVQTCVSDTFCNSISCNNIADLNELINAESRNEIFAFAAKEQEIPVSPIVLLRKLYEEFRLTCCKWLDLIFPAPHAILYDDNLRGNPKPWKIRAHNLSFISNHYFRRSLGGCNNKRHIYGTFDECLLIFECNKAKLMQLHFSLTHKTPGSNNGI